MLRLMDKNIRNFTPKYIAYADLQLLETHKGNSDQNNNE